MGFQQSILSAIGSIAHSEGVKSLKKEAEASEKAAKAEAKKAAASERSASAQEKIADNMPKKPRPAP